MPPESMRSSLVSLLREYADRTTGYIYQDEVAVLRAAADRLETLEKALREVITQSSYPNGGITCAVRVRKIATDALDE